MKVLLDNIAKRATAYKLKERVTYKMIKEYIEARYSFKVHTAYIAEVKRNLGMPGCTSARVEGKGMRRGFTDEVLGGGLYGAGRTCTAHTGAGR